MIAVQQLSKSYRTANGEALNVFTGLEIEIRAGEFVVIRGASGCGKTTLLLILGGMLLSGRAFSLHTVLIAFAAFGLFHGSAFGASLASQEAGFAWLDDGAHNQRLTGGNAISHHRADQFFFLLFECFFWFFFREIVDIAF